MAVVPEASQGVRVVRRRWRWVLGAGASAVLCAGVYGQAPAAPELDRAAELRAVAAAWPARVEPPGHPGARGVVRLVDAPDGLAGFQRSPMQVGGQSEADKQDAAAIAGEQPVQFEGAGSFLFGRARPEAGSSKP